jgi:hypothetical protein
MIKSARGSIRRINQRYLGPDNIDADDLVVYAYPQRDAVKARAAGDYGVPGLILFLRPYPNSGVSL